MGSFWVFGYGSLMWRPGFAYRRREPALLYGYHRALCIYSLHHRGTEAFPGLVMGLDHGGSCRGVAFQVAARDAEAVRDYLYEREQKSGVYLEVEKRVHLKGAACPVAALCYVVDRRHRQYAGVLPRESQVARILRAVGPSGRNVDYVLNTADILEQEMGIVDGPLHKVAGEVRARLADGVLPPVEPVVLPPLGQRSGPSHPIHEGEPIKRISSDRS